MRARGIKPAFFTNEYLVELGPAHAILFAALWCIADRRGVLEDRPGQILLRCPLAGFKTAAEVSKALDDLQKPPNRFIKRYAGGGARLIKVLNFRKHQSPHKDERSTEFPDFQPVGCKPEARPRLALFEPAAATVGAALTPDSPFPDSLTPDPQKKDGGSAPLRGARAAKPAKVARPEWNRVYTFVFEKLKAKKHGAPPLITDADRGLLAKLYDTYGPWMVLAAWELWMMDAEKWSKWAHENGHSIKAFHQDFNVILDDVRWKEKALKFERKAAETYTPKPGEEKFDASALLANIGKGGA